MTQSDQELLFLIASGNCEAFREFYFRYRNELFITASRVLRDAEEAADIVQEVFMSIWDRRADLRITGSVGAYLHTCVKYRCINTIQKNVKSRDYLIQLAYAIAEAEPHTPPCPLQLKELQSAIDAALEHMPPKMKEAFTLSRHQLLTHAEIAEKMGISRETVKKHIQGALKLLNKTLSSYTVDLFMLIIFLLAAVF